MDANTDAKPDGKPDTNNATTNSSSSNRLEVNNNTTARPYAVDPNAVQRASMRSLTATIAAPMPVLMEDENGYMMPKPPMHTFDNMSRSSLSRPSSVSPSFSLHSGSGSTVPALEWPDEESRQKYLENVRTYHRQRPTTVYSFALADPKDLSNAGSISGGEDGGIAMAGRKLEGNNSSNVLAAAAEEGRVLPDGKKKRDYFFKHFGWWRALMMVLLLAAVGVGLGLGLHYGLMNNA